MLLLSYSLYCVLVNIMIGTQKHVGLVFTILMRGYNNTYKHEFHVATFINTLGINVL